MANFKTISSTNRPYTRSLPFTLLDEYIEDREAKLQNPDASDREYLLDQITEARALKNELTWTALR